jgi:hypothetical protein
MEKNCQVEATSCYHCLAEDYRIPKMPVIHPLQAFVIRKLKKIALHGLSSINPNFSEFAIFGK